MMSHHYDCCIPFFLQALRSHIEIEHPSENKYNLGDYLHHNETNNNNSINSSSNYNHHTTTSPSPPHHLQPYNHHAMAMAIQLASSASRTSPTPTHDEGGRSTSSPGSSSTTMGDISIGSVGSGTSGYQCIQCPLSFQNRDQLEKHEVAVHDHLNHSPNSSGLVGNANQVI